MRGMFVSFLQNPSHLRQFVHQVVLYVQSACRIDQDKIATTGFTRGISVEGDGGRVRPMVPRHDIQIKPVGP